jgi:hypothetical protein
LTSILYWVGVSPLWVYAKLNAMGDTPIYTDQEEAELESEGYDQGFTNFTLSTFNTLFN